MAGTRRCDRPEVCTAYNDPVDMGEEEAKELGELLIRLAKEAAGA